MNERQLVDRYEQVCRTYKDAEREREELIAQLEALGKPIVQGTNSKYKRRSMRNVSPEQLQESVSTALWTSITKRIPVAALIKAAVIRGKLSEDLVDSCRVESKVWFAPTR